jgi:hypothetical protein
MKAGLIIKGTSNNQQFLISSVQGNCKIKDQILNS